MTNASSSSIDVHAHIGQYENRDNCRVDRWLTGDAEVVSRRARAAGVRWTIVSALEALCPFRGDIALGNAQAVRAVESQDNLLFWTVVDPMRRESIVAARDLLAHPKCMGIKMHPQRHEYEARVHSGPVFELAAAHGHVILTHSGDKGSYPEDFVPYADAHPEVQLIVAHLGNGDDGLRTRQTCAIQRARHRNIWTDTSSAMSMLSGVIEWAVAEVGDDRILFGTDTPLYFTACQKARIESAEIAEVSRRRILWENAATLFGNKLP